MEQDDSDFRFRKKIIAKGKEWMDSRAPNEYLVGILYNDKTPENADPELDIMWLKCSEQTTARIIQESYQEMVSLPQNVVIQFHGSIIDPAKTVADLNSFGDNIIVIEAMCEPNTRQFLHVLPSQTPPYVPDMHKTTALINHTTASIENTTRHPDGSQITPQEFVDMVTEINFWFEKLGKSQGNSSAIESIYSSYASQRRALTVEVYQMYRARAILFTDASNVKQCFFKREILRYINEIAGFYAWLFSKKCEYDVCIREPCSDAVFSDMYDEWRSLDSCEIHNWVKTSKNSGYILTPTGPLYPQITQTTVLSENDIIESSERGYSQRFSLKAIFIDSTPDIFETAVKHGIDLLQDCGEPLRRLSPFADAPEWLKTMKNLQKQAEQPKTIIGVVGNTGSGKSSVINAILDEEQLVPTNCMRACTAVVTEISYNHHEAPYRAEIEFITQKEWEKELRVLYSDLMDGYGDVSDETSRQETEAGIALAKIQAVYPKYTKDMLQKSSVDQLLRHPEVQEVLGGKKEIIEFDPGQLHERIQFYVDSKEKTTENKDCNEKNGSEKLPVDLEFWPLIKVVRIYVKSDALSTGAVIVDLPGVHDSNAARAAVAERYMKRCTGIWIVAPITRAVDDKAAKSLLGEAFKRQLKMDGGFDSVTFICSKTDDINISECQKALGLIEQTKDLWAKSKECKAVQQKNKRRLHGLQATKAKCIRNLDEIDDQIETWESLEDEIENGNTVFAPRDNSSGMKRGRGGTSNASGTPTKKHKALKSNSEGGNIDTEIEDELEYYGSKSNNQGQPLALEEVMKKLSDLKSKKKGHRCKRQEVDAEIDRLENETSEITKREANIQSRMRAISISGRNEYSRGAIQQDFAAGIRELDHEIADTTDALNFNPDVNIRDYDEVARSLQVFYVSTRAYQKLRGHFKQEPSVPGFRTVKETEISQLQAHCKKLTEASREVNYRRFLNVLDQLLTSLRLTASPDGIHVTDEQKVSRTLVVESEYEVVKNGLEELIKQIRRQIVNEIDADIIGVCDKAIENAKKHANETVLRWGSPMPVGGYHWARYKSLCRRSGTFSNKSNSYDWNAELIEPMMKAVAPGWEKIFSQRFHSILDSAEKECANLLESFHDGVSAKVGRDTGSLGSLRMVFQQMEKYQQILNDLFKQHSMEAKEKSKDINRMFQPVIAEKLDTVYEACAREYGKGCFKRMKDAMFTFVNEARHTMFHESVGAVKTALGDLCQSLVQGLTNKTEEMLASVKRDYMSALVGGVLPIDKRDALAEVLSIVTASETYFQQLASLKLQEELDSAADNSDEIKMKYEDNESEAESENDLTFAEEKDDTDSFLAREMDGLIKNGENGVCSLENNDILMKDIQVKPEPQE